MKRVYSMLTLILLSGIPLMLNAAPKGAMKMYDKTVPMITVTGLDILKSYIEGENPGNVSETDYRLTKLSKDSLETVTAYYKKLMTGTDVINEIVPGQENEYKKGWEIIFKDGEGNEAAKVTIFMNDNDTKMKDLAKYTGGDTSAMEYSLMPFPLMMMSTTGLMFGHTQKDLDDAKKKYMKLSSMFYRSYQKDMEDELADDYDKTIMHAYQKAAGVDKKMTPKQFDQWLQKEGMASVSKLYQKDSWAIWLDSLIELDKLAYPVKIVHEGSAFWK
ncbi:MAG: hypothetical protein A2Y33_05690 [Spirochaetes bacterium GWF1_51_8]|nr:MAG: hypothetical protein A2Y33_05690 [Spirochaetes bacterium GWF1_51_8]